MIGSSGKNRNSDLLRHLPDIPFSTGTYKIDGRKDSQGNKSRITISDHTPVFHFQKRRHHQIFQLKIFSPELQTTNGNFLTFVGSRNLVTLMQDRTFHRDTTLPQLDKDASYYSITTVSFVDLRPWWQQWTNFQLLPEDSDLLDVAIFQQRNETSAGHLPPIQSFRLFGRTHAVTTTWTLLAEEHVSSVFASS